MTNDVLRAVAFDVRFVPAGVKWDAIKVGRFLALQAIERIGRPGAVVVDPAPPEPVLYFLVPAGTAAVWDVPQTTVLGVTTYVPLPPNTRRRPPGPYWLNPLSSGLTPVAALRSAVEQVQQMSGDRPALRVGGDDLRRDADSSLPSVAGPDDVEVVDEGVIARAAAVLAVHHMGLDGWCVACLGDSIMTFYPCSVALWAGRVQEQAAARQQQQRRDREADAGAGSGRWPVDGVDPGDEGASGSLPTGGGA